MKTPFLIKKFWWLTQFAFTVYAMDAPLAREADAAPSHPVSSKTITFVIEKESFYKAVLETRKQKNFFNDKFLSHLREIDRCLPDEVDYAKLSLAGKTALMELEYLIKRLLEKVATPSYKQTLEIIKKNILTHFSPTMQKIMVQHFLAHHDWQCLHLVSLHKARNERLAKISFSSDDTCLMFFCPGLPDPHQRQMQFERRISGEWQHKNAPLNAEESTEQQGTAIYEKRIAHNQAEAARIFISCKGDWFYPGGPLRYISRRWNDLKPTYDSSAEIKLTIWDLIEHKRKKKIKLSWKKSETRGYEHLKCVKISFSPDDYYILVNTNWGYFIYAKLSGKIIKTKQASSQSYKIPYFVHFSKTEFSFIELKLPWRVHFYSLLTGDLLRSLNLQKNHIADRIQELKPSHNGVLLALVTSSWRDVHRDFDFNAGVIEKSINLESYLFKEALFNMLILLRTSKNKKREFAKAATSIRKISAKTAANRLLQATGSTLPSNSSELLLIPILAYESNSSFSAGQDQAPGNDSCWYLALNGEGLDAIICIAMLRKIEEIAGCPAHKLFHCITGSSVGSLIAFALAASLDGQEPLLKTKQLIDFFYDHQALFEQQQLEQDAMLSEHVKKALRQLFKSSRMCDCLTRVIVPWTEQPLGSPVRICHFDSLQAQSDPAKDTLLDEACLSTMGDGKLLPVYVAKKGNLTVTRRTSEFFKNNSAAFLYQKLFESTDAKNSFLLSLETGIVNENNLRSDELLKQRLGLWYKKIKASTENPLNQVSGRDLLDFYIQKAEAAVEQSSDIINQLRRSVT